MPCIIFVLGLCKSYATGTKALDNVDLEIEQGEIFALLGANGAGKTTLINIICGLVPASAGQILVGGHDIVRQYQAARSRMGLLPQEMAAGRYTKAVAKGTFGWGLVDTGDNPK